MQRNKVRLKVIPKHVIPVGGLANTDLNFSIEVVNLSEFAVVIADVGFSLTDGRQATLATVQGIEPSGKLPLRLEPRSSYSKIFHVDRETIDWSTVRCALVRTQCGTEVTGTSGALKQLIEQAGEIRR
jgi:hypothetical protein